jgi:DNA polymerase III subunit beta
VDVLSENTKHIAFKSENITILTRLIPDKYPYYTAVIPKDNPIRVSVDTKEFMETLDTASISIPVTKKVTMQVKDGKISLMAEDIDFSRSFRKELKTGKGEDDIVISFNCEKMVTILKTENRETTVFDFSTPERAMIVNEYCLLMPMVNCL